RRRPPRRRADACRPARPPRGDPMTDQPTPDRPHHDGFATRAIHVGQDPDPRTGAVVVPIWQTSTYVQDAVGQDRGWDYARTGSPTRDALQDCLASLEGAAAGVAFSSGMAAEDAVFRLLSPGDHVVMADDVY